MSDRYIRLNNCGYFEALSEMKISRAHGRVDYQLIYVKNGSLIIHQNGTERMLCDGSVYLYRPGEPQAYSIYGTPTTFFWIHFTGREAAEMLSFFQEASYNIGPFPEIERYCSATVPITENRCSELFWEGELICLFARLGERILRNARQSIALSKIRPVLLAMNEPSGNHLSNDELARLCNLNKYYFMKIFKNATGLSPQQYHTTLIIDKSKHLLEHTNYNISEIARLCGIEDCLYFSRLFKKHTGLSPANYRKKLYRAIHVSTLHLVYIEHTVYLLTFSVQNAIV